VWPEQKLIDELQTGVDAELKAGGATAFYAWLLAVDTSDFTPHAKPPMTEAKQRLIDIGRPAWELFYEDWRNERLDVPYCACRVTDLYKVYQQWGKQGNENILGRNRFLGYIASYERRRSDVHYTIGTQSAKTSFFMVGKCPDDKNQSEWLGGCVQEFERILQKHAQEAA
jgi:putative DNA primase/helicase